MNGNGNKPGHIMRDLIWDEDNPPYIHSCTGDIEHAPNCDGSCEGATTTELRVELINELRAWARADMNPQGAPAGMMSLPFVAGIPVEMIDLQIRFEVTRDILIENGIVTGDEYDAMFQMKKLTWLREIRAANEERVRKARVTDSLGIVQRPPLLGPNGEPIG